ncbi:MAG: hypothetical protein MK212_20490 [Saprospiraceae bacterium]|nr:hypothetical protein [Saprospiraceae bacterium]
MKDNEHQLLVQTVDFVSKEFEMLIETPEQITEEELRDILADQVLYWIERNLEHLFAILYRLDVEEELVHQAFAPDAPEPANLAVAQLIIDREKQKILSRQKYFTQDDEDDYGVRRW